jgi:serine O-acetyltransferase
MQSITFKETCSRIKEDICRFKERGIPYFGISDPTFAVVFLFRLGTYFSNKSWWVALYLLVAFVYKFICLLTGIHLPLSTDVGGGLHFSHYGCIAIPRYGKIGKNVTIHHGVTLGRVFGGKKEGVPIVGDNVVIFPGAKILGNVKIGNNAVIGANAVVVDDIPDYAVAVGIPARIVLNDSRHCFSERWAAWFHQSI